MKNDSRLGMRNKDALKWLLALSDKYMDDEHPHQIRFNDKEIIGKGLTSNHIKENMREITIGTAPVSMSRIARHEPMNDVDIANMAITMFHEFRHRDRETSKETPKDILIGMLSAQGNKDCYDENWGKLPNEIDAEYNGVMGIWQELSDVKNGRDECLSQEEVDAIMIECVSMRAKDPHYPIKEPKDGFQSKEQIDGLFQQAYGQSFYAKREFPKEPDYHKSDDELMRLFTKDERGIIQPEYGPFYVSLKHASGTEFDRKLASLVSYVHPELQAAYPQLDFEDLDPQKVFGCPMPETPGQIRERRGIGQSSASSRSSIRMDEYDQVGQELSSALEQLEQREEIIL